MERHTTHICIDSIILVTTNPHGAGDMISDYFRISLVPTCGAVFSLSFGPDVMWVVLSWLELETTTTYITALVKVKAVWG